LQEGDVITSIGGYETPNTARLQETVAKFSPGDNVEIKYVRDGKTYTKKVTLRNKTGDTKVTKAESVVDLGCAFSSVSKERLDQLEISNGVAVGGLEDGRFKEAGIRDGFIIISINGKRVNSAEDVESMYNSIMKGNDDKVMYIKGIYPTGKQAFYAVPLAD
jgi:S1-C subfamily serine protease